MVNFTVQYKFVGQSFISAVSAVFTNVILLGYNNWGGYICMKTEIMIL